MSAPPNKQKINALTVARLKPADKPYVVWDTVQRGLALRVRPTGARAWKAIYNRHGRTRWLHLGDANAIGLADARQLAAEAMLAVARGADPAADKAAQRVAWYVRGAVSALSRRVRAEAEQVLEASRSAGAGGVAAILGQASSRLDLREPTLRR